MAGRPLRKALSFILAASLATPGWAANTKGQTGRSPTTGSGASGAVGAAATAPGSVVFDTAFNLNLAGSIRPVPGAPALTINAGGAVFAAPAAPLDASVAPPAGPAAAPADSPQPTHAQIKAALNPPPGYAGHNYNYPVFWPANVHAFLHEPADKLHPQTFAGIVAAYRREVLNGAAGQTLEALASGKVAADKAYAGQAAPAAAFLGTPAGYAGKPVFGKKGLAPASAKPALPLLAAPNDAPLAAGDPAGTPAVAAANAPRGVAELKGAELKPFESENTDALLPPSPPVTQTIAAWVGKTWAALFGKTTPAPAPKQGKTAQPPPVVAAVVSPALAPLAPETPLLPAPPREELETAGGLLVHAARAVRRDARGYRVNFLGLSAQDGAKTVQDAPVRVRVQRSGDAAATAALRERFGSFNRLIENNFAALELMSRNTGQLTVKVARAMFKYVDAMAADYGRLVPQKEHVDVLGGLAGIGIGFEVGVKDAGLSDGDLLSGELLELITDIKKPSVHSFINRIHQGALEHLGRSKAAPANLSVTLGERQLQLTDISEQPLVANGRIVSRGFKALVGALMRSKDVPSGTLVMQDHQFHGHFKLGAHSAEIYANFLPPDEGGMIRVRYQEWGTGYDNQTRLYYVARLLQKTGFHVEQDNGFLTAVVDKDHASQSVDEMSDTFALVVQALHATVGVDFALPMLVEGATTSEEVGRRIDGWVDIVLGEGTLPFYVHDDQTAMISGWNRYMAEAAGRERLRAALDARLTALGLPPIPQRETMGQRTIDRFVSEAVEKAVARGELRLAENGRLLRVPGYDAVSGLARALEERELTASHMAEVVSSLDPSLLDFETVGSLGGLTVERAQRRLDSDSWLTVHVLRDPKTGQIGFARAEIAVLLPGTGPRPVSPSGLFSVLEAQGHPVARFTPTPNPPGRSHFMRLLKKEPEPEPRDRARFLGLAASPAHGRPVVARITYDKARAAQGGYIYLAPYTTPDDIDAIKASKGVLTTAGGLLSHAAITTREMGIPASILMGVTWLGGAAALETRSYGAPFSVGGRVARQVRSVTRVTLPEGAVVRLDPMTGALEAFPGGSSAALLDAAAALERYDADRDGNSLAAWLLKRGRGPALTPEQKEVLASEALNGLAQRALSRPEAAGALGLARAALVEAGLAALAEKVGGRAFVALHNEALYTISETRMQMERAQSIESVDRLRAQAGALAARLGALAQALGRPKDELSRLGVLASGVEKTAADRSAVLLAEDVAELQEHARRYPTATIEALPLIKAAIAKAKRRGLSSILVGRWEAQVRALEVAREASLRAHKPLVLPLSDIIDADVGAVGGKAAKLGEIAAVVEAAGGHVPQAVAPTVHAYRAFLREAGINERLEAVASDKALSPEIRSARARRLIMEGVLSVPGENGGIGRRAALTAEAGVGKAIMDSLQFAGLTDTMLAVRSSAVDEDGAEAAFAGAGDTHLYVSPDEVLPNVQEIWASVWNGRSLFYRESKGFSTANLAQALVIQEMVDAEIAGVAFTQDPVTGDTSRLIVNSAFGLGEGVVSNRVTPDQYVVGKDLGIEVLPPIIGDKKLAIVRSPDGKGTVEKKMPPEWRRRRSMTPEKLVLLNKVAVALERHFGFGLDLEYAFVGDKLYILQARAITSAAANPAPVAPKDADRAAVGTLDAVIAR